MMKESLKEALSELSPKPPAPAQAREAEMRLPHYFKWTLETCPECRGAVEKLIDERVKKFAEEHASRFDARLDEIMSVVVKKIEELEKRGSK